MKSYCAIVAAALLMPAFTSARAQAPAPGYGIDDFIKQDRFKNIKISPTGEYYAATVPIGRRTSLAVVRRADNKVMGTFYIPGERTHVDDFWWVNDTRVLISAAEKLGELEVPQRTGELYAINVDGSKGEMLVGQRLQGQGPGTRVQPKKVEDIAAFLVDDLVNDDRNVIISVAPFSGDPYTRVEKMDVYTGRRIAVTQAPIRNAEFVTDNQGNVRFALGKNTDNAYKLYYRSTSGDAWKLLNDSGVTGRVERALGFSADNQTAYLQIEHDQGPDSIVALDVASGARKQLVRDDDTDPSTIIYKNGTSLGEPAELLYTGGFGIPVGAMLMDGKPRTVFFDDKSADSRLYKSLEAAFPGEAVMVTSKTSDGRLALVQTWSDRNPGDFYIFDTFAKKADHLISRRDWFDPRRTAEVRPVKLKARDGLNLNGYLTLPVGSGDRQLPMVLMPHGGPYGIYDQWVFQDDAQLLAAYGYAVLQVNYRGSGNSGNAFEQAGAREWGGKMQDDLTDATRWAVEQGIADANRICIYGASYGGYAALMGVAREPELYKCAVGMVGVYDLPTMLVQGDIQERGSGETYIREWIGERASLAAVSPSRMADRIKVPVFLAAGGEDKRAPIEHSQMMERALRKAGVPVETLYFPTEGHGFYLPENRRQYYTKLLTFLNKNIGGRAPVAMAAGSAK